MDHAIQFLVDRDDIALGMDILPIVTANILSVRVSPRACIIAFSTNGVEHWTSHVCAGVRAWEKSVACTAKQ
jgi:hypothetical protein